MRSGQVLVVDSGGATQVRWQRINDMHMLRVAESATVHASEQEQQQLGLVESQCQPFFFSRKEIWVFLDKCTHSNVSPPKYASRPSPRRL